MVILMIRKLALFAVAIPLLTAQAWAFYASPDISSVNFAHQWKKFNEMIKQELINEDLRLVLNLSCTHSPLKLSIKPTLSYMVGVCNG